MIHSSCLSLHKASGHPGSPRTAIASVALATPRAADPARSVNDRTWPCDSELMTELAS
jgi:hypothetical protein